MKQYLLCRGSVIAAFFAGIGVSARRPIIALVALILAFLLDSRAYKRKKLQSVEAPSLD